MVLSTVLYGCESWLNADLKPVIKLYNWCLKQMLGVRGTTCNDICYIKSGCPPLQAFVKSRQRKFYSKMYVECSNMDDDPFGFVMKTVMDTRYNTKAYVTELIENNIDDCTVSMDILKDNVRHSLSSRRITYLNTMNPYLTVQLIYIH